MTDDARPLDRLADDIADPWQPRVVSRLNDYAVKLVRVQGEFVWHSHPETDELFLVLAGRLDIAVRDPDERVVTLGPHDLYVVPRGVEHCPSSPQGAAVLLVEPSTTTNTGDHSGELPDGISTTLGQPVG